MSEYEDFLKYKAMGPLNGGSFSGEEWKLNVTGDKMKIDHVFPIYIKTEKFDKLLVFQSFPESKIWFKNEEISWKELIEKLENI